MFALPPAIPQTQPVKTNMFTITAAGARVLIAGIVIFPGRIIGQACRKREVSEIDFRLKALSELCGEYSDRYSVQSLDFKETIKMETIVNNEFVTVWVYPDKKIIRHKFHKFIYGDKFRQALLEGADAFAKHRCTKWLSDDRENSALLPEDMEWGQVEWEPKIMAAGWKYWALILPEKVVGQMNMKRLVKRYSDLGIDVQVFSDPTKAMKWLEQQ